MKNFIKKLIRKLLIWAECDNNKAFYGLDVAIQKNVCGWVVIMTRVNSQDTVKIIPIEPNLNGTAYNKLIGILDQNYKIDLRYLDASMSIKSFLRKH